MRICGAIVGNPWRVCRKPARHAEDCLDMCEHCESDEHLAEDCLNGEYCLGKCNV